MILVVAIASFVNARGGEVGRLRRSELIEEMVHPMGRGENQEKEQ